MCFFAKKYKIVSSNLKPRVHLGRQASKNEINKSKPWSPIDVQDQLNVKNDNFFGENI
jgi:hypothetical protein